MQYYRPPSPVHFVGDCMPFFQDGVYHLYWLLDENHHAGMGGKGGHTWAHAATRDLRQWVHHPIAIGLGGSGEVDDASICTGSVFFHGGVYYAYYAARSTARAGERVCLATSTDGVAFTKHPRRPLVEPSGRYSARSFRDPMVFERDGVFHMLVTTCRNRPGLGDRAGCLAHYTSANLVDWGEQEPFVEGLFGRTEGWEAPECPDYFEWNGRHYLIYGDCSTGLTRYLLADDWRGPWRSPAVDSFDGPQLAVMKTAAFTGGRRIGAAFIRSRRTTADDAPLAYAGNAIFRELVQHADGSLGTRWPAEMVPAGRAAVVGLSEAVLTAGGREATAEVPAGDVRLDMEVMPGGADAAWELRVRGSAEQGGYAVTVDAAAGRVSLGPAGGDGAFALGHVEGLGRPWRLGVVLKDDLIDVNIDGRRTLCLRFGGRHGRRVSWRGLRGMVRVRGIEVGSIGDD